MRKLQIAFKEQTLLDLFLEQSQIARLAGAIRMAMYTVEASDFQEYINKIQKVKTIDGIEKMREDGLKVKKAKGLGKGRKRVRNAKHIEVIE